MWQFRRLIASSIAALIWAALPFAGLHAQQAVVQGGNWVAGHVPVYTSGTSSGFPVVIDSGLGPASVTAGTAGQLGWYSVTGSIISGNANATISNGALTLGQGGIAGQVLLNGAVSGLVTVNPASAAGTYNFNLPITAGTAGAPLLSGGGGTSPMTFGTLSGTTTDFATVNGALTNGHCVVVDASGNLVDNGSGCGGSGTVNAGSAGQFSYYASSTNAVSGSTVLSVSGGVVSTTGNFIVGGALTSSGTVTSGANSGTLGSYLLNGSSSGTITLKSQAAAGTYNFNLPITAGTTGQPLLSGGGGAGAETWGSLSGNTSTFATTNGSLTNGHAAAFDASGNLVDGGTFPTGTINSGTATQLAYYAGSGTAISGNGNFTVTGGALTTGSTGSTAGSVIFSGSSTGAVTVKGSSTTVGTYNFNLPVTAGTSGQPLLSGGGSAAAMTYGSLQGNTSTFATTTGAFTNGDCVAVNASGTLVDNGTPCGSGGSGTVTSSTANQVAYYPASNNAVAGNSSLTISGGAVTVGVTGAAAGSVILSGSSTGAITLKGSGTAIGTYNLNLPTTAGTAGQVLTSQGGGSSAMTWAAAGTAWGSGQTVSFNANAGTSYCIDTLTTGAVTMTLPTTPADGTLVQWTDCKSNFSITNFTVAPGGSDKIMGTAASMLVTTNNASATMVYWASPADWRLQ